MLKLIAGFGTGLLFGVGLIVAGMTDPAKVQNFLDIFGIWDPSLAFVMGGAAVTTFVGYRAVWRRRAPVLNEGFAVPTATQIDRPLIVGALIFGAGWGLGGLCPGPAWATLAIGAPGTLVFIPFMVLGLWLGDKNWTRNFITVRTSDV